MSLELRSGIAISFPNFCLKFRPFLASNDLVLGSFWNFSTSDVDAGNVVRDLTHDEKNCEKERKDKVDRSK